MSITHNYKVNVNWLNGRTGVMFSPELNEEILVATPPQFPGGVDKVWSPEHLLIAAANSCLMTTFLAIAENFKLDYVRFSSNAEGKLEQVDGQYMISEITLHPTVVIKDEATREKALRIISKAEAACLISNSIKSKITCEPNIVVSEI